MTIESSRSALFARLCGDVAGQLQHWHLQGRSVAVGLSGGLDSVVLLDLLASVAPGAGVALSALHVNHGLSAQADAWTGACARLAESLGIPLAVHRVQVRRDDPRGIEAAARAERHRCYAAAAVDAVALAHHADDQAETVLLQLLRGAGAAGIAAMPACRRLTGTSVLIRPLLAVKRDELLACARERGLSWVEDESNEDRRFSRNYLRHAVMPLIAARFPGYRETLARAADNAADLAALADRLGHLDLARCAGDGGLDLGALAGLDEPGRANVLRLWLREAGIPPPPRARLLEMLSQALQARPDAGPCFPLGTRRLVRHRGWLQLVSAETDAPVGWNLPWQGEPQLPLPDGRVARFVAVMGQGVRADLPLRGRASLGTRRGGERMRLHAGGPHRTLKNLLQEAGIPSWERSRLPLLYLDGDLVHVPGVGTAPGWTAGPGEAGLVLDVAAPGAGAAPACAPGVSSRR
jgi:tRNA(Ile)-lysidine synthase